MLAVNAERMCGASVAHDVVLLSIQCPCALAMHALAFLAKSCNVAEPAHKIARVLLEANGYVGLHVV